ncbi:MAG TPA: glyoxalase superfamily protein, partial [Polyangiaceae bacterium]|nr:glyoxalase superfamily protein [Polyangiaceae bacterium]
AREFYLGYLGFSVDFEHRFEPDTPLFMQVSRGGITLRLSEHHGDGTPGSIVTAIGVGIEALHRELHGKHYKYMNPGLETTEWGTRDVCVVDPFGNRIIFSERVGPSAGDVGSEGLGE